MKQTKKQALTALIILLFVAQPVCAETVVLEEVLPLVTVSTEPQDTPTEISTPTIPEEQEELVSPSSEKTIPAMTTQNDIPRTYVENEVLVKYKENTIDLSTSRGRRSALKLAQSEELTQTEVLPENNVSVLTITDARSVEETIARLKNNPTILYAQPNYLYYPATISTNDTHKDVLWGLENTGQTLGGVGYATHNPGTDDNDIDAPEAWNIAEATSSTPVIVAIIDTGVAYNHPDLAPNMWDGTDCVDENGSTLGGCMHGYDFEEEDVTPLPATSFHGTHLAGIIAAEKNNAKGTIGVAPHAQIMALKTELTSAKIIRSIHFATQNGAKIINASWVGSTYDTALYDAIEAFPGLFIAAAGNTATNNESSHSYPSDYDLDNIISVAATDQSDVLTTFSNYGATSVDVGAPGANIYSTTPGATTTMTETFNNAALPGIPTDWMTATTSTWGTYDAGLVWENILYGDLSYPYASNTNAVVTSPTLDLGAGGASMDFWTNCDTEYSTDSWTDYMQLEFSADGITFTPATNPYTGDTLRWDEPLLDSLNAESPLSDADGALFHFENIVIPSSYITADFAFRFRWVSNAIDNTHDGCFIDNITVSGLSDGSDEEYVYANGTSMAAPHVAGLAALLEAYNPSLTPAQVKELILSTGDNAAPLSGTTVSGKRINAFSALDTASTSKAITSFSVPSESSSVIDEDAHTITTTVPFGTAVTALTPTIVMNGASIAPLSGLAQNFTNPVLYTVTAPNSSTQTYTVTVLVAADPHPHHSGGGGGGGGGGSPVYKYTKDAYGVLINNGSEKTTTGTVTLTITPVLGSNQIQISNTADFATATWLPFKKTVSWKLSSGAGTKTVYVRYGKSGKILKTVEDSIGFLTTTTPTAQPVVTATAPIFTSTLSLGSRNQEVTALQNTLIAKGFLKVSPATGYYGTLTQTAVRTYQQAHGLAVTGTIDQQTRDALNKENAPNPSGAVSAQSQPTIASLQAQLAMLMKLLAALQGH